MPAPSAPPVRAARQARSRETEQRILRALRELLDEKSFDQLSIADVAGRAGVSVGGFYARFASKHDALLHLSYAGYVADAVAMADRDLDPARWAGAGIAPIAEAYFRLMVRAGHDHHALLRELVQRHRADPAAMRGVEAWERFQERVHGPFRRLLAERIGAVRHPDPALALRVGFSLTSSALREALLFPHMGPPPGELTPEALAVELTRLFCGYLGVPLDGSSAA
ncbi:MAG TPA: TetR/AcrR family transcriptional regulator [Longimicrobium sp.]|nr:TetR/AcrR family transcriptional regulator [Longimicrobium sp.]